MGLLTVLLQVAFAFSSGALRPNNITSLEAKSTQDSLCLKSGNKDASEIVIKQRFVNTIISMQFSPICLKF